LAWIWVGGGLLGWDGQITLIKPTRLPVE
jgi:hypothetical protein